MKQRLKTWLSSNTGASFKSSKARFKEGDEVRVSSKLTKYDGMQGVVLESVDSPSSVGHRIDGWVYQVSIYIEGLQHIQYFVESELDYTLQRKREDRLKELGI